MTIKGASKRFERAWRVLYFWLLGIILVGLLSACSGHLEDVRSIELSWLPKEHYVLEEAVALDQLAVTVHFKNNLREQISFSDAAIEKLEGVLMDEGRYWLDTSDIGNQRLLIRYGSVTLSIDYRVREVTVWDGETRQEPFFDAATQTFHVYLPEEFAWLGAKTQSEWDYALHKNIQIRNTLDFGGHPFDSLAYYGGGVIDGQVFDAEGQPQIDADGRIQKHKILGLSRYLIEISYIDLTVCNLLIELDLDIQTGGFGSLVFQAYDDVLIDNVDIHGRLFSSGTSVGAYVGMYNGDFAGADTQFRVTMSKPTVTVVSTGENHGVFIGHGVQGAVVIDTVSVRHTEGHSTVYGMENSAGTYHNTGLFVGMTGVAAQQFPENDGLALVNRQAVIALNFEQHDATPLPWGHRFVFHKSPDTETVWVTFTYTVGTLPGVGGSYPRQNTRILNVSLLESDTLVHTPFTKQRVTQDAAGLSYLHTIYNDELAGESPDERVSGIGETIWLQIVERNSAGQVIRIIRHTYQNEAID